MTSACHHFFQTPLQFFHSLHQAMVAMSKQITVQTIDYISFANRLDLTPSRPAPNFRGGRIKRDNDLGIAFGYDFPGDLKRRPLTVVKDVSGAANEDCLIDEAVATHRPGRRIDFDVKQRPAGKTLPPRFDCADTLPHSLYQGLGGITFSNRSSNLVYKLVNSGHRLGASR